MQPVEVNSSQFIPKGNVASYSELWSNNTTEIEK